MVYCHAAMRVRYLLLVLVLFCVYNANRRELGLADTVPTTLLAASLVIDGDLALDEFSSMIEGEELTALGVHWTSAIQKRDGHYRSSYPVGGALLAAPLYALPVWFGAASSYQDFRMLGKLSASLMVALSAAVLMLILARFLPPNAALGWALVYGLGTGAFAVASQALWQQGPSLLCLSLAVWATLRAEEAPSQGRMALAGLCLGMAVICRHLNGLPAVLIGGYLLYRQRAHALGLLAAAGLCGAFFVSYNVGVFGQLVGGIMAVVDSDAIQKLHGVTRENLMTFPVLQGMAGVLLAPNKGALAYSPVLLLMPLGLIVSVRDRVHPLFYLFGPWCLGALLVLGSLITWWGGTAYGSRYFCEILIPWVVLTALGWRVLKARRWIRALVVALALYGIGVQVVGALRWDCNWAFDPRWAEIEQRRFWDVTDTEVGRCTAQLLREGPHPADF